MPSLNSRSHSFSTPPKLPKLNPSQKGSNKENVAEPMPLSPPFAGAAAALKRARDNVTRHLSIPKLRRLRSLPPPSPPPVELRAHSRAPRTPWFFASVRPRTYVLRGVQLPGLGDHGPDELIYEGDEALPRPMEETFAEQEARAPEGEFACRTERFAKMDPVLQEAPVKHPCVCRGKLAVLEPTQLGAEFYVWYAQRWALYRAGQGEIGDFEHAHTDAEHVRAELDVEACFGIFRTLQEDPRAPRITPVNFSISKRFLGGQELVIQLVVEDDAEGPPRARVRRGTAL